MIPVVSRTGGTPRATADGNRAQVILSGLVVLALLAMLGVAAVGGAPSAAAQSNASFPTAEVAPEDALAYVVFTLDQKSDQWKLGADLLDRAGLGAPLKDARDQALTDSSGKNLPLDAFLGGEVALIVTDQVLQTAAAASSGVTGAGLAASPVAADAAPAATGAAVVLDAGAPDTAFAGIESSLQDDATKAGTQVATDDYKGVTIESTTDEGGNANAMAIARVDDHILIAATAADLHPLIDTSQGDTPSLSKLAAFTDVRGALDQDYLLYGFFNGVAAAKAEETVGGPFGSTASAFGAGDRYSGTLIAADDPGFRMETVAMPAEGATLPPAADNFESEIAKQTPGDALFFLSAFDLGKTGVLDAIGAALLGLAGGLTGDAATPVPDQSPEEAIAAQYEQASGLLGFNLQTDFFQQLVGEYGLSITSGNDPSTITALFASGVKDPATVVKTLKQLTLLIQGGGGGAVNVTTRQLKGASVNVIDTGDPSIPKVEYGVVDNRLLIGVGKAIDTFVKGPKESLADNAQFQEVMDTLPAERNGTLYVDLSQIIPLIQGLAASSTGDAGQSVTDASPDCANYPTQEEAQQAYDAGADGTIDLDQDFDGQVCEDFFAGTPEAAVASPVDAAQEAVQADYSAIKAFALAAYDEDGNRRSSSILYIGEKVEAPAATPTS